MNENDKTSVKPKIINFIAESELSKSSQKASKKLAAVHFSFDFS